MKKLNSVDELRKQFPRKQPGFSSDTRFSAQALMLIAEQLERVEKKLATRHAISSSPQTVEVAAVLLRRHESRQDAIADRGGVARTGRARRMSSTAPNPTASAEEHWRPFAEWTKQASEQ